jgi:cytochrome b561
MNRYPLPSIVLHWLLALLIGGGFVLGLYMHELPLSPQKLKLYSYHKWLGVTIFALVMVRLLLRWRLPLPPLLPAPVWQMKLAQGVHHALYLLMFAVPLSGWLMSSAKGFQTVWFGVLPLPDLVGKDETLGKLLQGVHEQLNWLLLLLVLLHAAAAIKHHFLDRDATLARMLPWAKP